MRNIIRRNVVSASVVILICSIDAANAFTGNVLTDFEASKPGGHNPNGPWTYLYGAVGTSMIQMFEWHYVPTAKSASPPEGLELWNGAAPAAGDTPALTGTLGGKAFLDPTYPTVLHYPLDLLLDPAGTTTGAIACWTAATAGSHTFTGLFEVSDTNAHGVGTYVFANTTNISKTVLPNGGYLPATVKANGSTLTPGTSEKFSFKLTVNIGGTLCFGVAPYDGNGDNDATGFRLLVTPAT